MLLAHGVFRRGGAPVSVREWDLIAVEECSTSRGCSKPAVGTGVAKMISRRPSRSAAGQAERGGRDEHEGPGQGQDAETCGRKGPDDKEDSRGAERPPKGMRLAVVNLAVLRGHEARGGGRHRGPNTANVSRRRTNSTRLRMP
jgi:hypothetical protein